jgi:hypothetical protein
MLIFESSILKENTLRKDHLIHGEIQRNGIEGLSNLEAVKRVLLDEVSSQKFMASIK